MSKTIHYYTIALITLTISILCVVALGSMVKAEAIGSQATFLTLATNFRPIDPNLNLPQPTRSYLNIQYCQTADPQQSLDIFAPAYQPNQPAPAVIYVHGGGWSSSGKRNGIIDYYKQALLDQGMALISINHRLAPHYTFPIQNQDVACAIDYIHRMAGRYGLDGQRLALFGESSGAQLITAAALHRNASQQEWYPALKAVVSLYGISDFKSLLADKNYRGNARVYLGGNPQAQALKASVIYQDLQQPPPFLIVHGDKDKVVPANQSIALYRHLQKYNPHNQLLIIKGAGHGITMKDKPNSAQLRTIVVNYLRSQFVSNGILSSKVPTSAN